MVAILLAPLPFTVSTSSATGQGAPANLRLDEPGMVWRSAGPTGVYVVVQLDGSQWDSIAIVGNNLPSGGQWRMRAGPSADVVAGNSAPVDVTFDAWEGVAPLNGALSASLLPAPVQHSFVRVDALGDTLTGFVEASRLVIGQRVEFDGVDVGAQTGFDDGSTIEDGPGFTTINPYGVRDTWKATVSGIEEDDYYRKWRPFLRAVGMNNAFVFMPDDRPVYLQATAIFGRIISAATVDAPVSDAHAVNLQMRSLN